MKNFTSRQKEIIDMAIGLIAENGIQNLTTKNLSNKLDISEPAIYRHFSSKLDILMGILTSFEMNSLHQLEKIKNSDASCLSRLENIFVEKCREFSLNPQLAHVIFSEEIFQNESVLSEKVILIMKLHQSAFQNLIKEAQNNFEIRSDIEAEHLSIIIMGSLRLLVTKWRLSKLEFDILGHGAELWKSISKLIIKE